MSFACCPTLNTLSNSVIRAINISFVEVEPWLPVFQIWDKHMTWGVEDVTVLAWFFDLFCNVMLTAISPWYILQVESIVLSIISMLSSPNDESPANVEAAVISCYIFFLDCYIFLFFNKISVVASKPLLTPFGF